MHGPLSEIGLIEVLQLLERGGRSGVLRVSGVDRATPIDVHLDDGVIVAVEPPAGDAATRRALKARHLVGDGEEDVEDQSVLDRPVSRQLRAQLAAHALDTMVQWRSGRFDFTAGSVAPGPLALSPDALVFDLVGREGRRVELAPALAEFRAVPDFAPEQVLRAGIVPPLSPADWRLLDLVDGERDVRTLAVALDDPLEDVAGRIQALGAALILELHSPQPDAGRDVHVAIERGRFDEAARLLRARVMAAPGDGNAWRTLGLAEVGAGRFEEAITAWQSWRDNDPDRSGDAAVLMQAARTMVEALRDARD